MSAKHFVLSCQQNILFCQVSKTFCLVMSTKHFVWSCQQNILFGHVSKTFCLVMSAKHFVSSCQRNILFGHVSKTFCLVMSATHFVWSCQQNILVGQASRLKTSISKGAAIRQDLVDSCFQFYTPHIPSYVRIKSAGQPPLQRPQHFGIQTRLQHKCHLVRGFQKLVRPCAPVILSGELFYQESGSWETTRLVGERNAPHERLVGTSWETPPT